MTGSDIFEVYENNRGRLKFPHFELYHSGIIDWRLVIWEQDGIGEGAEEKEIISVQDCDLHYVLSKAEVLFKEWLLEHKDGY